jgi:protein-S-isoprenylcysteine O-methyltransferase Ste14
VAWLVGAVYNLRRAPAARRRTRLPSAWLFVSLAYVILFWLVPARVWGAMSVRTHWVTVCGVVILVAATGFTLWARASLGLMWTSNPVVKHGHVLRTTGPYGVTRHPIYTGMLGMILGSACLSGFGSWLAVLAIAVPVLAIKLRTEERLLEAAFGETYLRYQQQVPRLIPLLRRAHRHREQTRGLPASMVPRTALRDLAGQRDKASPGETGSTGNRVHVRTW